MKISKVVVLLVSLFGLQVKAAVDFDQIGRILRDEVQYSSTDKFDVDCGVSNSDTQSDDQGCKMLMSGQQNQRERAFVKIRQEISGYISGIVGAQDSVSQQIENLVSQDADLSQVEIADLKKSGSLTTLQISAYANNAKLLNYSLASVKTVDQKTFNKAVLIKSIVANLYEESKNLAQSWKKL